MPVWNPQDPPEKIRAAFHRELTQILNEICYPGVSCWLCHQPIRFDVKHHHPMARSVDHVVPLSKGGHPIARENVRPAHFGCNSGRGNRDPKPIAIVRSRRW